MSAQQDRVHADLWRQLDQLKADSAHASAVMRAASEHIEEQRIAIAELVEALTWHMDVAQRRGHSATCICDACQNARAVLAKHAPAPSQEQP